MMDSWGLSSSGHRGATLCLHKFARNPDGRSQGSMEVGEDEYCEPTKLVTIARQLDSVTLSADHLRGQDVEISFAIDCAHFHILQIG